MYTLDHTLKQCRKMLNLLTKWKSIMLLQLFLIEGVMLITITQGPQDTTVYKGQSASFDCQYTGTNQFPIWHINGKSYYIQGPWQGLPDRHRYSNQMMTVSNVQNIDNRTTYRCSFFDGVTSSTGTLTVLPLPQVEEVTSEAASTTNVPTTVLNMLSTTSVVSDPADAILTDLEWENSSMVPTSTQAAIHSDLSSSFSTSLFTTGTMQLENLSPVYIGTASGVAVIIMVITSSVLLMYCHIRGCFGRSSKNKLVPNEPIYEDVPDVPPDTKQPRMDPNICYSTKGAAELCQDRKQDPEYAVIENVIQIKSNDAYSFV